MSDYSKITDYAAKDTLLTGNPGKLVKGSEIGADFDAVAVAVATKADKASPTFTGTVTVPAAAVTGEVTNTATSALQVAVGTTAQRPTGADGKIRYNTDLNCYEMYDSTLVEWSRVGSGSDGIGYKNKIINGGMQVAQRGDLTLSGTAAYGKVDRWKCFLTGSGASGTATQGTTVLTTESGYSLKFSSCSYTGGTFVALQYIESINSKGLNSSTITISANVYHNFGVSANFRVLLYKPTSGADDSWGGGETAIGVGSTTAVATATKTTISGSFTLNATDASNGLVVYISHDALTVSGKDIYIGDVQLEKGAFITDFDLRPISIEETLCQRYYFRMNLGASSAYCTGYNYSTNLAIGVIPFPEVMRSEPSAIEQTGTAAHYAIHHTGSTAQQCTSNPAHVNASKHAATVQFTVTGTLTAGQGCLLRSNNTSYLGWSAEI